MELFLRVDVFLFITTIAIVTACLYVVKWLTHTIFLRDAMYRTSKSKTQQHLIDGVTDFIVGTIVVLGISQQMPSLWIGGPDSLAKYIMYAKLGLMLYISLSYHVIMCFEKVLRRPLYIGNANDNNNNADNDNNIAVAVPAVTNLVVVLVLVVACFAAQPYIIHLLLLLAVRHAVQWACGVTYLIAKFCFPRSQTAKICRKKQRIIHLVGNWLQGIIIVLLVGKFLLRMQHLKR